ncbi:MAG: 16S rRNA (cytidine(1402)-2'-O)-methyltransferase [Candidatus Margulisiibacteriota bacterium]
MPLYICATPIGNLEDITFRAVRILKEVDIIAAEDTRHTKKLLDHYDIKTPATSYHKFNIKAKTAYLIDLLKAGKNIALVSDSGTPAISDPGCELVQASIEQGIQVVTIPGPSAVIAALSISGLPTDSFSFVGFLPKKPGKRRKALEGLQQAGGTAIIYESPFRLTKTLEAVVEVLGESVPVAVARELTKKFEEVIRGSAREVKEHFLVKAPKGEIVLLIDLEHAAQSGEM